MNFVYRTDDEIIIKQRLQIRKIKLKYNENKGGNFARVLQRVVASTRLESRKIEKIRSEQFSMG
jgi:hypothetical protein